MIPFEPFDAPPHTSRTPYDYLRPRGKFYGGRRSFHHRSHFFLPVASHPTGTMTDVSISTRGTTLFPPPPPSSYSRVLQHASLDRSMWVQSHPLPLGLLQRVLLPISLLCVYGLAHLERWKWDPGGKKAELSWINTPIIPPFPPAISPLEQPAENQFSYPMTSGFCSKVPVIQGNDRILSLATTPSTLRPLLAQQTFQEPTGLRPAHPAHGQLHSHDYLVPPLPLLQVELLPTSSPSSVRAGEFSIK